MKRAYFLISTIVITSFCVSSCSKDAGQGGNSTIWGKVYVKDYNTDFSHLIYEYYAPEIDVYIIYGNDMSYGDRTRTNYDGTYEFKYLRSGNYKIYAYSTDSLNPNSSMLPVIQNVEITKRKQTIDKRQFLMIRNF